MTNDENRSSAVDFDAATLNQLQHVVAGHSVNTAEYEHFLLMLGIDSVPVQSSELPLAASEDD